MKTTKQLARELGIIRKKTCSNKTDKVHISKQPFSFLVVLDFESTCWQDGKFRTQEIIEFPAVLLNTLTGEIESEFQFYVQPQEQPVLSEFCKQLTGITQEQVDDGIPLHLCIRKFARWLEGLKDSKGVVFTQTAEKCNLATIVTWSDWDLGVCLYNESRRKQIVRPAQLNSWIDLRATYRKFYSRKPNGLNGALKDVGIEFEGREHSGLHDSRNTARLAYRMIKDGCILNITKTLKGTNGQSENYLPSRTIKQLTLSKSPLHKRRRQSERVKDDDPDNESVCRQDIDNLLIQDAVTTPDRKRKSRVPLPSPNSTKKVTKEKIPAKCSKLTKTTAKRILAGKFDPSDIYVDPVNISDAYINGSSSTVHNKLVDISNNIHFTQKTSKQVTPTKGHNSKIYLMDESRTDFTVIKPCYDLKNSRYLVGDTVETEPPRKSGSQNLNGLAQKQIASEKAKFDDFEKISPVLTSSVGVIPVTSAKCTTTSVTPCRTQSTLSFKPQGTFKPPSARLSNTYTHLDPNGTVRTKTLNTPPTMPLNTPSTKPLNTPSTIPLNTPSTKHLSTPLDTSKFRTPSARPLKSPTDIPGYKTTSSTTFQSSTNPSSMKGTPPLCNCGKSSKRRMVQTPGPNLGRFFFTCGSSYYNSTDRKNACGFFKWETPVRSRCQSFTQNGTLSKPFVPVFNNCTPLMNATLKKNLGVRSNSISSFR